MLSRSFSKEVISCTECRNCCEFDRNYFENNFAFVLNLVIHNFIKILVLSKCAPAMYPFICKIIPTSNILTSMLLLFVFILKLLAYVVKDIFSSNLWKTYNLDTLYIYWYISFSLIYSGLAKPNFNMNINSSLSSRSCVRSITTGNLK